MTYPFTARRRILWGDSDPAGVIYTPRVFHYAIETIEEWLISVLGFNWMQLQDNFKLDTPTIKMGCEFMFPLRTGDFVEMELNVKKLGSSSINYIIDGFDKQKRLCFRVDQVSCFVDAKIFKPVRISEDFRSKILSYQESCDEVT